MPLCALLPPPKRRRKNMIELSGWCTIQEISSHLAVPNELVRITVKQASEQGACWVRKQGRGQWLVDTQSPAFQQYQALWQDQALLPPDSSTETVPDEPCTT